MYREIDIPVRLDAGRFRKYCRFDALKRQRRWFMPVLIAMALITVSVAGLLGFLPIGDSASGLLLGLGLAVPMVSFGLFFIQIESQVARSNLKESPLVYTLRLTRSGVSVANGQKKEAPFEIEWDKLWAAYQNGGDIYLYATPARAFILPEGQATAPQAEVWKLLRHEMGDKRCIAIGR